MSTTSNEYEEIDKSRIGLKDLRKMMIKQIPENVTPYQRSVLQYNNNMLEEFFQYVVEPNCDDADTVNCTFVVESWPIFQEGKETEVMHAMRDQFIEIPQSQIDYWKTVFDQPVDEMLKLGRCSLLLGFETLTLYYRQWLMDYKYQVFFNENTDPNEWIVKKKDINEFEKNNMEYCPIDFKKYTEKIATIMQNQVQLK